MKQAAEAREEQQKHPRMFLIPCSCGTTFAIAEDFDRQGTPAERFWKVDGC
jgi:hypothetical protein